MTESCEAHEPSGGFLLNRCIAEVKSRLQVFFDSYLEWDRQNAFWGGTDGFGY